MTNEEFQALAQRVVDADIHVKKGSVKVARRDLTTMEEAITYEDGFLVGTRGWSVRKDSEYFSTNPKRKAKFVMGWRVSSPTGYEAGLYSTKAYAVRIAKVCDFICGDDIDHNGLIKARLFGALGEGQGVLDAARFVGYEEDHRAAVARKNKKEK